MPLANGSALHIAAAFDQNYITPFYVLLTSLLHNNAGPGISIHCIATGVSEAEKNGLALYVRDQGADILFYNIDEDYVRKNVVMPEKSHFTIATYYRLFMPSLMPPAVQKLLFLDTDLVVNGDLRPLYNTALGNAPFAAVPDSYPHVRTDLGFTKEDLYFNAGVLLMDVANWKKHQVTEKAMRFLNEHPDKIKYVDQDALNASQKGAWVPLPKKYNVIWFDVPRHVSRKKLAAAAVIIHYTTSNKPWNALGGNKLRFVYHGYLKKSPHANRKKYVDFKWTGSALKKFLLIRFLEWYYEHPRLVGLYRKISGRRR